MGRWRGSGIRCHHYLDDMAFGVAPDPDGGTAGCREVQQRVRSDIKSAGFIVNESKLRLEPTHQLDFIGFSIDTVSGTISATATRAAELAASVGEALSSGAQVPARLLARIAGQVASLRPAFGNASNLFTRGLYDAIDQRASWRSRVPLTTSAISDLLFWRDRRTECDGQPLWPSSRVDTIFYSDAGADGWGGWQHRPDGGIDAAHGLFSGAQRAASSTLREAIGLLNNLRSLPRLGGRSIRAIVDNQALEWAWYGGSKVPALGAVLRDIYDWLRLTGSRLSVFWLPRELNQRADALSKAPTSDDWQLKPSLFATLNARWGPHTFDRFASDTNKQLSPFSSYFWCPGTAGLDAFTFSWAGHNNWINPPFSLMPKVIAHLRLCQAVGTVICPWWPKRPWWHLVCPDGHTFAPYITDWVELPNQPDLFLAAGGQPSTASPHWRVFALRIDFRPKAGRMAAEPPVRRSRHS